MNTCCADHLIEAFTSTLTTITTTTIHPTIIKTTATATALLCAYKPADPALAADAVAALDDLGPALVSGISAGLAEAVRPLVPAVEALATPRWEEWLLAVLPQVLAVLLTALFSVAAFLGGRWWERREAAKKKRKEEQEDGKGERAVGERAAGAPLVGRRVFERRVMMAPALKTPGARKEGPKVGGFSISRSEQQYEEEDLQPEDDYLQPEESPDGGWHLDRRSRGGTSFRTGYSHDPSA